MGALGLIGEKPPALQPAFYVDGSGTLKLRPDLSSKLHQNPIVFAAEAGAILQHSPGGIHIDVGCGSRKITAAAIGIDIADGSAPYVAGSVNISTRADNLYPFADGTIDFISCMHSFEHYDNPKSVLTEWIRVLRVGGRIGVVVPHATGLIPDKSVLKGHQVDYSPQAVEELLASFGGRLTIVSLDTLKNGWSLDFVVEKTK